MVRYPRENLTLAAAKLRFKKPVSAKLSPVPYCGNPKNSNMDVMVPAWMLW